MLRTLAAIAMIAAALPGTAIACGISAGPLPRIDAPRAGQVVTIDRPVAEGLLHPPASLTGTSRCVRWYEQRPPADEAATRRRTGVGAARDIARR